jgi:hypothetical protein
MPRYTTRALMQPPFLCSCNRHCRVQRLAIHRNYDEPRLDLTQQFNVLAFCAS